MYSSNPDIIKLLIKHGAKVNYTNKCGETPLHHVWNADAAKILVEHGADINAQDICGVTPLHNAKSNLEIDSDEDEEIKIKYQELIDYLISIGATE